MALPTTRADEPMLDRGGQRLAPCVRVVPALTVLILDQVQCNAPQPSSCRNAGLESESEACKITLFLPRADFVWMCEFGIVDFLIGWSQLICHYACAVITRGWWRRSSLSRQATGHGSPTCIFRPGADWIDWHGQVYRVPILQASRDPCPRRRPGR